MRQHDALARFRIVMGFVQDALAFGLGVLEVLQERVGIGHVEIPAAVFLFGLAEDEIDTGSRNYDSLVKKLLSNRCDLSIDRLEILVGFKAIGKDFINHPDLASNIWTNPGEIPGYGTDDDGNGTALDWILAAPPLSGTLLLNRLIWVAAAGASLAADAPSAGPRPPCGLRVPRCGRWP